MSLKLLSDFAKTIAQVLSIPESKVDDYFEIGETKDGYFYAKRRKSKWLEQTEFKTMCSLARDYNGEYIKDQQTWRVPGPFAKKGSVEGPSEEQRKPTTITPSVGVPQDVRNIPLATFNPNLAGAKPLSEKSATKDVRSIPLATLPVKDLLSMPFVSRTTEDPELAELVESIKTYGVLEPIVVRPKPSGAFEVVAGARRLRAAKEVGLIQIPVVIKPLSDQEAYEIGLIENIQRKDLTDIEKARMLNEMLKRFPNEYSTHEILAFKLGKSRSWVSNLLGMIESIEKDSNVKRLTMLKPDVSVTETQALMRVEPEKRAEVVDQIKTKVEAGEVPSVREIKAIIEHDKPEAPAPKPEDKDVGEFECPLCHFKARIAHADPNKHKFVPYSEESLSQ